MLRRNARLRKEFLYRKSLEGKEKELYEKKRKIRQALEGAPAAPPRRQAWPQRLQHALCSVLPDHPIAPSRAAAAVCAALLLPHPCCFCGAAEGKPIPTELRREEAELRKQVRLVCCANTSNKKLRPLAGRRCTCCCPVRAPA